MKKTISILIAVLVFYTGTAKAQNPSFSPGSFTANDQFTLTIDVTGTPMAGQSEAYIWIFSNTSANGNSAYPSKDGYTNTAWANSPATAKMTAAGTNKWSFTLTGSTMFSQTPAELKDFGFLVKAKDGSKQSPDYKPFFFDPLVFVPAALRIFPAKVDKDDVVTLNFERTLAATPNEQRMQPATVTVTLFDETGAQVGLPKTIPVKQAATNIWNASIIPADNFSAAAGHRLAKFRFKFNGTVLDASGVPAQVTSSETETQFTTLK